MYDFTTMQASFAGNAVLPSVAMIFNGKIFEEEISGYRTLNVSGRETTSNDLETSGTISGRDGDLILSKTVSPRTITVQYRLEAGNNEEFQYKFRHLVWLLDSVSGVPIQFIDDAEITYYGQLATMETVPPESNLVIGTFELHCGDPYKYETPNTLIGNPVALYLSSPYPIKPDEIKIMLTGSATKITVDNITTGSHIILNGSYASGDVIVIKIADNTITKNNQNIMANLDYLESDLHRFTVSSGDSIQVTPITAAMATTVRGRWK